MPREQLLGLVADVGRLLGAGSSAAARHDGLARRARVLRELSAKVPILAAVADAVERVVAAPPEQVGPALLDLAVLARQVRGGLSAAGAAGEWEALPPSGPWSSPAEAPEVARLTEALEQSGAGREKELEKAVQRGTVADLRLVGPLLKCLKDRYAPFADMVADKTLLKVGPSLAPELERRTDPAGGAVAARCLRALGRLDPEAGPRRCRELLGGPDDAVRVQALESLAESDAGRSVDDALACLRDRSAKVRGAAYAVLGAAALAGRGRALEALLAGLGEPDAVWQRIKPTLVTLKAPGVRERLAAELEAMTAAQGGEGKAGINRGTARRIACRLAEVLGERADRKRSLPLLLPLAREAPAALRAAALRAAGECGLQAVGVLEVVIAGLRDGAEDVANAAVFSLPWRGPEVPEAVPALREVIANARFSGHVRHCAVLAFGGVAPRSQESVDFLVGLLRAGGANTASSAACEALAKFGPAARSVLPVLGEVFLKTLAWMLPYHLVDPLVALDPDGTFVVPLLVRALTEPRYLPSWGPALDVLERYRERARPAIPALEALAANGPREEAYHARQILAALGHAS